MEELLQHDETLKILQNLPWTTILTLIVNFFVLIVIFKIINRVVRKTTENLLKADRVQLAKILPMLARLLKVTLFFLAVAAFLQSKGYSVNSFLAGFGITGLAVGFAAKEAISDIFGSFSVIMDKVFRIGDFVNIGGEEGNVEDINFRSTRLRKLDNTVVAIPNRTVSSVFITNYSLIKHRMVDETIGITYDTPNEKIEEALEIVKNIALNDDRVLNDYQVFIEALNASSIDIRFVAYLKTTQVGETRKIKTELILKIVEKFREAGINFAFPSMSVYMEK